MAHVVSFIIQKGGCGKTTTTVNTSGYLADKGFRVLCVDMDPQGNLTQHFGIENENLEKTIVELLEGTAEFEEVVIKRSENLHVIPNNLMAASAELPLFHNMSREYLLRNLLAPQQTKYDYIMIDCPPTLGLYSINALTASTEFIMVVAPEFFPMRAIKPLYDTYKMVKQKLNPTLTYGGVVMTMCDFRTKHSQEIYQILKKNFPTKLYKSYIRNNVTLKEASSYGQTIFEFNAQSVGAYDYMNFTEEFIQDHHTNKKKLDYYQLKFESLSDREQKEILLLGKKHLSAYNRVKIEQMPDKQSLKQALFTERNKILEKLFPYRTNFKAEQVE